MLELSPHELRVIGCLLEKEVTTPEQYPLTLNALTTAVNQKTNRDPVYAFTEAQVMDIVEQLKNKRLISDLVGFGSRVTKYQHRFCNTEFGSLQLSDQQKGILCVLFLRGAQTPGELRTRTNRLCDFPNVSAVETELLKMTIEGLVVQLAREAGKREHRYFHCFTQASFEESSVETLTPAVSDIATLAEVNQNMELDSLSKIEARVSDLEMEVKNLKIQLAQLLAEFGVDVHEK